ncbi:hypothetical protein [Brevibacillus sp. NRS-1366]|uniref:hypothetical protein n=1 Tax=Brevibacillus sp. NRS-1366 TaxID=3233899 RepID=UPI003D218374
MTQLFEFQSQNVSKPLLEKEYEEKRNRAFTIGKSAIDELIKQGKRVSYRNIEAVSKTLDPVGRGIHANTVRSNEVLYEYYLQFARTVKTTKSRTKPTSQGISSYQHLKPNRDLVQVQKRYLKMSRGDLVARLIEAEEYIAQHQTAWQRSLFEKFK